MLLKICVTEHVNITLAGVGAKTNRNWIWVVANALANAKSRVHLFVF